MLNAWLKRSKGRGGGDIGEEGDTIKELKELKCTYTV